VNAKDRDHEPTGPDVRPFLPRPGEPAEAYAARLRALHRELTGVLEAVERGLEERRRTQPPVAPVPDPAQAPAPTAGPPPAPPRVETAPPRAEGPGAMPAPPAPPARGRAVPPVVVALALAVALTVLAVLLALLL
jgi:hypothetical protein